MKIWVYRQNYFNLFKFYLIDRKQYVENLSTRSNVFSPTSGIPQGSNLGPILFLIFINDLADVIKCENLLFADNLKIFTKIESVNDCYNFQRDLSAVETFIFSLCVRFICNFFCI